MLYKQLLQLSPLVLAKLRTDIKKDRRSHLMKWEGRCNNLEAYSDAELPAPIKYCIKNGLSHASDGESISDSTVFRVRAVASMPSANVMISERSSNVAVRLLFNFGAGEIYTLRRAAGSDTTELRAMLSVTGDITCLDERDVYVPDVSVLNMANGVLADYTINVSGKPPATKPFTATQSKPTGNGMTFVRLPRQKITILVDIIDTDGTVDAETHRIMSLVPKMKGMNLSEFFRDDTTPEPMTKSEVKAINKDIGL